MSSDSKRRLAGGAMVVALAAVVALAVSLFNGSFTATVPVTVITDRAGLVMNPDAKVKVDGVQVGEVASIREKPDGTATLTLAMNPDQLKLIPSNVSVDIASSTVFGAKFVQMSRPADPAPDSLSPGAVLRGKSVTVEVNTVFQQLTTVLQSIDPIKLNQTLGALSKAFGGRGQRIGETITDLNAFLGTIEPSLPNLGRTIEASVPAFSAYADAAPDLIKIVRNAASISSTVTDEETNLDAFLISATGLADVGNDVVGANRQGLADANHLLVPTTSLLNEYGPGLKCSLQGMLVQYNQPPAPEPGINVAVSFTLGVERYRYPTSLPKVAATGGPHCGLLPKLPFEAFPKYYVTDQGANPFQYGNQGILLNSDGLKQILFGPIAGPPRNTSQLGQPG